MLVIAIVCGDYMGQYGIVWNRGVVEVAGIESASLGEPTLFQQSIGITRQT